MRNIRKLSMIRIIILVMIITIAAVTLKENIKRNIKFEQVYNSVSYFSNADSQEVDELNTKNVYVFDTEKQWNTFREKYLQGEPKPNVTLAENEKIIFIHTKWEDINWGNSYYVNEINYKGKTLNIFIKKNGKIEKKSGFPQSAWLHDILIIKIDGKMMKDDIIVVLRKEE